MATVRNADGSSQLKRAEMLIGGSSPEGTDGSRQRRGVKVSSGGSEHSTPAPAGGTLPVGGVPTEK